MARRDMSEPCLGEKLVFIFEKASEETLGDLGFGDPIPREKFLSFLQKLFSLLSQAFKEA